MLSVSVDIGALGNDGRAETVSHIHAPQDMSPMSLYLASLYPEIVFADFLLATQKSKI